MTSSNFEHKSDEQEERLQQFGEKIIKLSKKVPKNTETRPILNQLIKAGTSIGANYMEANGSSSKRDFRNKIHICKKEAKETMYWLRMLSAAYDKTAQECRELWLEVKGYAKWFATILSTMRKKK